jgi:type III pantothenate kinase
MSQEQTPPTRIAVDVGNSRIKFGEFRREIKTAMGDRTLPEPVATFDLSIVNKTGEFDVKRLSTWADSHSKESTEWRIASVHRGATERLTTALHEVSARAHTNSSIRQLTYRDISMTIRVDAPERVGIDRLLAALAVNRLRSLDRPAIIVDLGTAITIDLVEPDGAFAGGAILPGVATAARALAEQTDALPSVAIEYLDTPPDPLGKSTVPAIESGIYWGAIGAIREIVERFAANLELRPEVFLTGGASKRVAELLAEKLPVHHAPNLVLSGIALVEE